MWSARTRPCRCGISREQRIASGVVGARRPARTRALARARVACGRRACRGRRRRRSEGFGAESAGPRAARRMARWPDPSRASARRIDRGLAHGLRMSAGCRRRAARDGRGLHRAALRARAGQGAGTDARERRVQRRIVAPLRRSRGRSAVASETPSACVHQPRQRIAGASRSRAHTARLCRCVRRQPAASARDGHDARARGVLRHARRAAACVAGIPDASILASCSIPFWLDAVHDIAGAPREPTGTAASRTTTCTWTTRRCTRPGADPALPTDTRARLARQAVQAPPSRQCAPGQRGCWYLTPNGSPLAERQSCPDRSDFKAYGDDATARQRAWRVALAESAAGRRVRQLVRTRCTPTRCPRQRPRVVIRRAASSRNRAA